MTQNLLNIFAKYPEPGRVKTRLAAEIGNTEALRIYRACTEMVLAATASPVGSAGYDVALACWPPKKIDAMAQWLDSHIKILGQHGHDLGSRMHNVFAEGFTEGYTKVIIIGTDCPAVTHELIMQAFAGLDSAAVVIGPASDGGYYLIGLRHTMPALFEGISWGTELVFNQTLAHCRALKITCALLPELRDIDRRDDLDYYRQKGLAL
jgi:uncharacterized protein